MASMSKNDSVSKLAKELVAVAKALVAGDDTPSVYVGTYAKYNNGDLSGKWVDLEDFNDYDEFIEYCKELHKDEEDPEFMFQDYENIPSMYITESTLKPEVWDYIEKIKEYDKEIVDAVLENRNRLNDLDDSIYYDNCMNMTEVAERVVDEMGGPEELSIDTLSQYFDYEAYGRDLEIEGTFIKAGNGYIQIM